MACQSQQSKHPCILRAEALQAESITSPFWREHFNHRLMVKHAGTPRHVVEFTGSYEACIIAMGAFSTLPYRIVDCTGAIKGENR